MSALRNIVIAMVALQLGLMVINNVEIVPGTRMTTDQMNNGQANIDPTAMLNSIGDVAQIVKGAGSSNRSFSICTENFLGPVGYIVSGFTGIHICYTTSNPNIIEQFILLIQALFVVVTMLTITILSLAYDTSAGAIPFYTQLFGLIDPTLGGYLGLAVGGTQAILVIWYVAMLIIGILGGGEK